MRMRINRESGGRRVQVQIVTYNSASLIVPCLQAIIRQTEPSERVLVIDNASSDSTVTLVKDIKGVELITLPENNGYAGGHNVGFFVAINAGVEYVVTVNPDTMLSETYVSRVLDSFAETRKVGGSTGKLVRQQGDGYLIDTTGLYMGWFFHVKDRDRGLADETLAQGPSVVWGICGAAAAYSVEMLRDIEHNGQIFDEKFFVYKEDVDLCWRARRRGWQFWYNADAMGTHRRGWLTGNSKTSVAISHSFVNQIALLIRHVPRLSPMLILAIMIEFARWLRLLVSRRAVAFHICRMIKSQWTYQWAERRRLRTMDSVGQGELLRIQRPGPA